MTTIDLPELTHRAPANTYLTTFPERITADWINSQFDDIDARIAKAGDDGAAWVNVVRHFNEIASHVATLFARVRLAFRQASDNEVNAAENKRLNVELAPVWSARYISVTRALATSPCLDALKLEFGDLFGTQLESSARTSDPINIPLAVELSEKLTEYTAIFGSATVTWRGDELPISFARKAAHDEDKAERHAAHQSVVDFLVANEDKNNEIFDTAFALRTKMAENLGMKSYIELRYAEMERFDWTPKDAARFRNAIKEHVVPIAHALRQQQARSPGTALVHPADTEIWPDREPAELTVELDDETKVMSYVLHDMGDRFAEPFDVMRDEHLLDMPARPGKGTGAFCTSFPDQRVP
ncbi:MAG: hypothetical protein H7123_07125, partial [Thermoleophilia bacterium]|nr:hypothetical protein [Thermoleophilia bacterium]